MARAGFSSPPPMVTCEYHALLEPQLLTNVNRLERTSQRRLRHSTIPACTAEAMIPASRLSTCSSTSELHPCHTSPLALIPEVSREGGLDGGCTDRSAQAQRR